MANQQAESAAKHKPGTRRVGTYSHAIYWIAVNDDTLWLDDEENGSPSVTLCLVADIFGRSVEEATEDLRRAMASEKRRVAREQRAQEALEQTRRTVRAAIAAASA